MRHLPGALGRLAQSAGEASKTASQKVWLNLKNQCSRVLAVIEDALDSENIKERMWAVELLIKRFGVEKIFGSPDEPEARTLSEQKITDFSQLSDAQLMAQLEAFLKPVVAPNAKPQIAQIDEFDNIETINSLDEEAL